MLYLCDMEALRTFLPLFLALCIDFSGYCQGLNEITNAPFLKSISFKAGEGNHQFPLVQKGSLLCSNLMTYWHKKTIIITV